MLKTKHVFVDHKPILAVGDHCTYELWVNIRDITQHVALPLLITLLNITIDHTIVHQPATTILLLIIG